MYTVSDVVETGDARELIMSLIKEVLTQDDSQDQTARPEEYFDE